MIYYVTQMIKWRPFTEWRGQARCLMSCNGVIVIHEPGTHPPDGAQAWAEMPPAFDFPPAEWPVWRNYRPVMENRQLRLTTLPEGAGPYDRWELTVESTGELLASGPMPLDERIIRTAGFAYRARFRPAANG